MNARSLTLAVVAVGGALGVAVACSFPSPELRDDLLVPDALAPTDGPTASDAKSGTDGEVDGQVEIDASNPEVVAPLDASKIDGDATVTLPDGEVVNCDEDNDTYAKVGGSCGGFDCNDKNRDVRPNQGFNTLAPIPGDGSPGTNGDWNCNGTVERELKFNVDPSCPSLLGGGCANEGFVGVPACGSMARYVRCVPVPLGCSKNLDTLQPVACK
jgi:hypothetical protein